MNTHGDVLYNSSSLRDLAKVPKLFLIVVVVMCDIRDASLAYRSLSFVEFVCRSNVKLRRRSSKNINILFRTSNE